jgi:purine/pyrimidine-nucleoside phosphorylase
MLSVIKTENGGCEMFKNVDVVKRANFYFGGQVSSRTVIFPDGSKKTLGVMLPGEYEFGTDLAELMEILAGRMEVLLPGNTDWQTVVGGEEFHVPAQASFKLKVFEPVDYCCSYLKD